MEDFVWPAVPIRGRSFEPTVEHTPDGWIASIPILNPKLFRFVADSPSEAVAGLIGTVDTTYDFWSTEDPIGSVWVALSEFVEKHSSELALIISESSATDLNVLGVLKVLGDKPLTHLQLGRDYSATNVSRAIDASIPQPGATLLVSGWEQAFDKTEVTQFRSMNFYRELLFRQNVVQIWWMNRKLADAFRHNAFDTYGRFSLVLEIPR